MTADICGAGGNYGVHQEPLACAHPKGHDGPHAWESLPTFVNGQPVNHCWRSGECVLPGGHDGSCSWGQDPEDDGDA